MNITMTEVVIAAVVTIPAFSIASSLLQQFISFIITTVKKTLVVQQNMADNFSANTVAAFLAATSRGYSVDQQTYEANWRYILSEEKQRIVFQRNAMGSNRVFLYKRAPILISPAGGEKDRAKPVSFTYIKGTVNWHQLLLDAAEAREKGQNEVGYVSDKPRSDFYIFNYVGQPDNKGVEQKIDRHIGSEPNDVRTQIANEFIGFNRNDIGSPSPDDPLKNLALSKPATRILRYCKFWFSNEKWYKDREIPYQLGIGIVGKPGSGKSRLIRSTAQHIGISIHSFNLASMNNHDFLSAWTVAARSGKRIILFEDFDAIFHGRINVIPDHKLSFDTILNCISGVEEQSGLLLFITTNHPEHLDPALCSREKDGRATRPNRIDFLIELPDPDYDTRLKIGKRIAGADGEMLAKSSGADETIAQFQWRCTEHALKTHWSMADLYEETEATGTRGAA